jgi:PAS domain S-box-containing protein
MPEIRKIIILHVDDNETTRYTVGRILKQAGYEVREAATGAEGLQKAQEQPDLIVLDVNLPDINGFEVCKRLKADPATNHIPVLHLSATFMDDQSKVEGLESGADGYQTHPIEPLVLNAIIKSLLRIREMERQIRKKDILLAATLRSVGDGVIAADKEGRITFMNPTSERLTGWKKEDAFGKKLTEVLNIKNEERESLEKHLVEKVLTEGLIINLIEDHLLVARDGTETPISDSAAPIMDDEGEKPGTVLVFRDITKQKKTEEKLRDSEEKYRNLFENATQAIFVVQDGKLAFLNPMTAVLTGYSEDELMTRPFTEFLHPEDLDMVYDRHARRMKGEEIPHIYSFRIIHKDGNIRWVELNTVFVIWKKKAATLNFLSNITDRKRMEEELIKTQKLESIGILAGGIAHDFNNILTSIAGNISMAKMRLKPGDKIFDLLSSAENASVRAQGLTRQLLTFAKGGAPVKETASIQKLIRESALFVVRGSKSECDFQIAEDLWPVEADAGQMSQVISNIVINANQAMPEGGIIRISAENMVTEKIQDMPVSPGKYIHISVKDDGVGIAEKHLSKVFDPYFTTKQTGSGLGLATAYSIIKKHNGHIFVNSSLGKGTTFNIYLPASDKKIPVKKEAALLTGCGRILMMDDDEFLKELAKEMLDMLGYESEFAENGAEAIEMYKKARESGKPYDAVILDLTIPGGMGGKETIKKLLEIDPEIKAVVFSGYSDDPVMSNYREYGFKGMMPKPFDTNALGKVLNEVLK